MRATVMDVLSTTDGRFFPLMESVRTRCVWLPLCSPVTPLLVPHPDASLALNCFLFLLPLFSLPLFSHSQAALLLLTRNQEMQFTQAMRQPRPAAFPIGGVAADVLRQSVYCRCCSRHTIPL
ncbi:mucin-associated surface protein (MASP) [Trypanosoma cruzi]|nr:mucin-associated surface protein (MASP) [Trypanosoma cruzi]